MHSTGGASLASTQVYDHRRKPITNITYLKRHRCA